MASKKSCKCGEYGSFECLFLLFKKQKRGVRITLIVTVIVFCVVSVASPAGENKHDTGDFP